MGLTLHEKNTPVHHNTECGIQSENGTYFAREKHTSTSQYRMWNSII